MILPLEDNPIYISKIICDICKKKIAISLIHAKAYCEECKKRRELDILKEKKRAYIQKRKDMNMQLREEKNNTPEHKSEVFPFSSADSLCSGVSKKEDK